MGVISARVAAISTPIFFVATGLALAEGLRLVHVDADPHATKLSRKGLGGDTVEDNAEHNRQGYRRDHHTARPGGSR